MHFDQELDARQLKCFMLTLSTKKALNAMDAGNVLKVTAAGPGMLAEFNAFTNLTGDTLVASTEADNAHIFYIRKKPGEAK